MCSGGGEVRDGVDSFLLVGGIGGAIAGTGGGSFGIAKLAMGTCKKYFEGSPSFVGIRFSVPDFAIIMEHAGGENDLESGGNNLRRCIRSVTCGGVVHGRLDLVEEGFNGEICVVRRFEFAVIG